MVIGRVEKAGSSKYNVVFELLDVLKQSDDTQNHKTILSMKYDNISAQDLRKLAHQISDQIFERLIGVKGIFSTRIAYISVMQNGKDRIHTLEVADSDGFNPKALQRSSFPMMSPAWSPNGRHIAFVSFDKDRASVNVADVMTGRIERITQYPGINGAPSWSPDGRTLAVVLSKDGGPKIYTVDVASKKLSRLTDGTGIDTEPSWSPDGQSIVFTSNRGGKPQIYRVSLSSGKTERLTFNGDYNAKPSLTPDGKRLVMLHRGDNGSFSIAVQNLSNSDLKVLTNTSLNDSPSIAPNGMMVMYGSKDGERGVLGAVTLDGRVKIRIPSREGNVQEPAWSPFN
jgi:TolB protein